MAVVFRMWRNSWKPVTDATLTYCSRKETGQTGFLVGVTDWYADLVLCVKKTFHGDETGSPKAGPKFPPWELIPQDPSLSYIPAPSLSRDGSFGPEGGSCVKEAWASFISDLYGSPWGPGIAALLGESNHLGQSLLCRVPVNLELSQVF